MTHHLRFQIDVTVNIRDQDHLIRYAQEFTRRADLLARGVAMTTDASTELPPRIEMVANRRIG